MQRNSFVDACIAMTLGVGAGMVLSVFGQKMINEHYKTTCNDKPGHNLVLMRGFLGDTYYCIDSKYMN